MIFFTLRPSELITKTLTYVLIDNFCFIFYNSIIIFRYADDSFTSAFVATVGIDFKVKTVFRQDKRVKLQIWVSKRTKNEIIVLTKSRANVQGVPKKRL